MAEQVKRVHGAHPTFIPIKLSEAKPRLPVWLTPRVSEGVLG